MGPIDLSCRPDTNDLTTVAVTSSSVSVLAPCRNKTHEHEWNVIIPGTAWKKMRES